MSVLKKLLCCAMTVILACSLFGGCQKTEDAGDTAGDQSASAAEDSKEGRSITVVKDVEITSLDPIDAGSAIINEVVALSGAGLYTLDADGNAVLDLAEKVEESEDGMTLTYTLKDAKWSNGEPVTAHDYEYAWKRIVDPANYDGGKAGSYPENAGIKNAAAIIAGEMSADELGCYAQDDKTFVVELERKVPYYASIIALSSFYPVNQAFVEERGAEYGTSAETTLSNGPFLPVDFEVGATSCTFKRNPDFTGYQVGESNLEEINYTLIKDSQQAMLAYQNGDVDVVEITGEQVENYKSDPGFHQYGEARTTYMAINCGHIQSAALRDALAHCIDKEKLCSDVLKDGSMAAYCMVPEGLANDADGRDFREGAEKFQETDLALAAEEWEKAKEVLGVSEYTMEFLITSDEAAYTVGAYIQDQIQNALPGVTVELKTVPFKSKMDYVTAGDFDFCIVAWGADYPDPLTFLNCYVTGNSVNVSQWSNADYDSIIDNVLNGDISSDQNARFEELRKAEKLFLEEASVVPLYQNGICMMINPDVEGIEYHSIGISYIYRNVSVK